MANLHVICQHKMNWTKVENGLYETGEWVVADDTAEELKHTHGRVYLHEIQKGKAWHGGAILDWRRSTSDPARKIFTYQVDGPFRINCPGGWSQEMAISRG